MGNEKKIMDNQNVIKSQKEYIEFLEHVIETYGFLVELPSIKSLMRSHKNKIKKYNRLINTD